MSSRCHLTFEQSFCCNIIILFIDFLFTDTRPYLCTPPGMVVSWQQCNRLDSGCNSTFTLPFIHRSLLGILICFLILVGVIIAAVTTKGWEHSSSLHFFSLWDTQSNEPDTERGKIAGRESTWHIFMQVRKLRKHHGRHRLDECDREMRKSRESIAVPQLLHPSPHHPLHLYCPFIHQASPLDSIVLPPCSVVLINCECHVC